MEVLLSEDVLINEKKSVLISYEDEHMHALIIKLKSVFLYCMYTVQFHNGGKREAKTERESIL